MAWIESHQTLRNHPKLIKLARILNIDAPSATGHLHFLWWWCMDYAMDGDLSKFNSEQIAEASGWQGSPSGAFLAALVTSGLVDQDSFSFKIHDWYDFCGEIIKKRLERRAMRLHSAKNGRQIPPLLDKKPPTVPDPTVPDPTVPDPEDSGPTPPNGGSCQLKIIPDHLKGLKLYEADERLCHRLPVVFSSWESAYPGVNIRAEIAKAHAWEMANPQKRKRDRIKFLTNWLNRAQDRGGSYGRGYVGAGGGSSGSGNVVAGLASPVPGKYANAAQRDKANSGT